MNLMIFKKHCVQFVNVESATNFINCHLLQLHHIIYIVIHIPVVLSLWRCIFIIVVFTIFHLCLLLLKISLNDAFFSPPNIFFSTFIQPRAAFFMRKQTKKKSVFSRPNWNWPFFGFLTIFTWKLLQTREFTTNCFNWKLFEMVRNHNLKYKKSNFFFFFKCEKLFVCVVKNHWKP